MLAVYHSFPFNCVLGVLFDVRFLLAFSDHVSDWKSGLRAVEEELKAAFGSEIAKLEFLFETFEFFTPMLGGFARH
jgi:hypothetical protein